MPPCAAFTPIASVSLLAAFALAAGLLRDAGTGRRADRRFRQRRSDHGLRDRAAQQADHAVDAQDEIAAGSARRADRGSAEGSGRQGATASTSAMPSVNNAFANTAKPSRASPEQFAKALEQHGLNPNTLKARMRAELVWSADCPRQVPASLQIGEKDIVQALQTRDKDQRESDYEYTLRPIVFVVPRGSAPAVVEARKQRSRGAAHPVSGLRERRRIRAQPARRRRSRADPPQFRRPLAAAARACSTRSTSASSRRRKSRTGGIEVFAVCGKKKPPPTRRASAKCATRCLREQFQAQAKRFLKELRSGAMIEYR